MTQERDLELLHANAIGGDVRAWFKLAQAHERIGNFEMALNVYGMRSGLPGDFDETYCARYKVAKMMEKLHRGWPEIMNAYLEAYRFDPRRAEPLYYVAKRYKDGASPELARLFAIEAARKKLPGADPSFVEVEIYETKALELVTQLG